MPNSKFSSWPAFTQEEAVAVQNVLLSNNVNYWTGSECRQFENDFAVWSGSSYAVSLANGTVALVAALKALGIGAGDEVIVTPRTFIASASCVVEVGAIPVFADVDSVSGNITAETIERVLTPRCKAVICVHLAGWPCDMDPIIALAGKHGLMVVEDCAQAHGARYKGRCVGSIGHVGAWSFCQDKVITTGGEGGMVTTNDEKLWRAMWSYKDHGKSYDAVFEREKPSGFSWVHENFGSNARMMEMQAVIGRIQLRRLRDWTRRRTNNGHMIWMTCSKYPALRVPAFDDNNGGTHHAFYKCYVYVNAEKLKDGWSRDRIIKEINALGVPCFQGSCSEVYLEKAFEGTGWRPEKFLPNARMLGETSLMFLVHPTLTQEELEKTCTAIDNVMRQASQ